MRSVFFYKIAFKNQSLNFAVRDNIMKVNNVTYHCNCLWRVIFRVNKIRADAVFQDLAFTNINYLARTVVHDIYTRTHRQVFKLFLYSRANALGCTVRITVFGHKVIFGCEFCIILFVHSISP